jgi:hypothetical protein
MRQQAQSTHNAGAQPDWRGDCVVLARSGVPSWFHLACMRMWSCEPHWRVAQWIEVDGDAMAARAI